MHEAGLCGSSIRGVTFDAGNTLIRVRNSVGAVYAEVARRHGGTPDPARLEERFHAAFDRRRSSFLPGVSRPHSTAREKAWWRSLVEEVFQGVAGLAPDHPGFGPFFEDLYREFERAVHWRLFPDVTPCLQTLFREGIPVAVVSNWDSRLRPVLCGLGITRFTRFVLTSAEFGAEKPDPAIFREAAARLGLAPNRVLHVGDSLVDDVRGARAAGLRAAWLQRRGTTGEPGEEECLTSLGELFTRSAG